MLPREVGELIDAVRQGPRDGESACEFGCRAAGELVDVAAATVAALDAEDREADLAALGAATAAAAIAVVDRLLAGQPARRLLARQAVALLMPAVITGAGLATPRVEDFKRQLVLPALDAIEATTARVREKLGGK